jgi:hypothetical protein
VIKTASCHASLATSLSVPGSVFSFFFHSSVSFKSMSNLSQKNLAAKKAKREASAAMKETVARIARDSFVLVPEQVQRQLLDDADHVRIRMSAGSFFQPMELFDFCET